MAARSVHSGSLSTCCPVSQPFVAGSVAVPSPVEFTIVPASITTCAVCDAEAPLVSVTRRVTS